MVKLFKEYMLRRHFSNNTIDSYVRDLNDFVSFLDVPIHEATRSHVRNFIEHIQNNNVSIATSNRKLSAIKSFYKFCVKEDLLDSNPAELVECSKPERRLPKILDKEDVDSFVSGASNLRDRVIFEMLYGTGVRREELIKIKINDINFRRGCLRVIGKGDKERIVPINPIAMKLVAQLMKEQDSIWLFPSSKVKGDHISKRRLNEIVKNYADKLNIKGATPHKFRHSLASHMYEAGADIRAIQSVLGHSSINTTNLYTQINVDRDKYEYMKLFTKREAVV
jgi:site-specific recombinase XerD